MIRDANKKPVLIGGESLIPDVQLIDKVTGRIAAIIDAKTGKLRYIKDIAGKMVVYQRAAGIANGTPETPPPSAAFYQQAGTSVAEILEVSPEQLAKQTRIADTDVVSMLDAVKSGPKLETINRGMKKWLNRGWAAAYVLGVLGMSLELEREWERGRQLKTLSAAIAEANKVDPMYEEMLAQVVPLPGWMYDCQGGSCACTGRIPAVL